MADLGAKPGERYANTDEMRAEFGSYRVNNYTDTVRDDANAAEHDCDNMAWSADPIDNSDK